MQYKLCCVVNWILVWAISGHTDGCLRCLIKHFSVCVNGIVRVNYVIITLHCVLLELGSFTNLVDLIYTNLCIQDTDKELAHKLKSDCFLTTMSFVFG